jgi:DNA gyrase/topoisomerase IV subunit B
MKSIISNGRQVAIVYEGNVGEMSRQQVYDAFYDETKRRLIKVTPEGVEAALDLVRSLDERKKLLTESGILSNPYNLK